MTFHAFRGASFAASVGLACALVTPAFAADTYKPSVSQAYQDPAPAHASNWYLGGLLGYGVADTVLREEDDSFGFDSEGAIAGGILGWNMHHRRLVFGFEGDLVGGNMDARIDAGDVIVNSGVNWMLGLRTRAGYHVSQRVLLFGTFGVGWADMDLDILGPGGRSASQTFVGVQYGAGAEVTLARAWSLRMDYIHTDLGSETVFYPGGAVSYEPEVDQFRGGLLYRF